tara:strand:- start:84 stop:338 length:255 start_codon:yes stop_codon:yes gene_type:complete
MARHKMVNGIKVMFTPEEEAFRDAEELEWSKTKPLEDWKADMQRTDESMPRYMEDLITDNPSLTIHENMKTRYDEKVALRATKP